MKLLVYYHKEIKPSEELFKLHVAVYRACQQAKTSLPVETANFFRATSIEDVDIKRITQIPIVLKEFNLDEVDDLTNQAFKIQEELLEGKGEISIEIVA